MFALALGIGLLMYALQVDAYTNLTSGLFGPDGPQLTDIWPLHTTYGWFEVPLAGVIFTEPNSLTDIVANVNMTHASVRLWTPPVLEERPSAVVMTVEKRSWDLNTTSGYQWPSAIYDAFTALYHQPYPPEVEEPAYLLQNILNSKYLFHAILGPGISSLMCPLVATDQLFLAVVNTINGPQIEAVTDLNPAINLVTSIQRQDNLTQWTQTSMSSWSGNCVEAWVRG